MSKLGIILDIIFIRKLLIRFYNWGTYALIVLYIAYSVDKFGLFMGLLIFNVILGATAGMHMGRNKTAYSRLFERGHAL